MIGVNDMQFKSFKDEQLHNTELLIRAINRRLEKYGQVMYTPEYLQSNKLQHTEQYKELENKVFYMLRTSGLYEFEKKPNGYGFNYKVREGVVGKKGTYIQISRSKDVIESLVGFQQNLKKVVDTTPTWQELLDSTEYEVGHKLSRKEKIEVIKRISTIKSLSNLEEVLGQSGDLDVSDNKLQELLKPFRGVNKGGTRLKGQKVSSNDWSALMNYLKIKYGGANTLVNNSGDNISTYNGNEFSDTFTDQNGKLDFATALQNTNNFNGMLIGTVKDDE